MCSIFTISPVTSDSVNGGKMISRATIQQRAQNDDSFLFHFHHTDHTKKVHHATMIGPPVRKLREDKERSEEKSKESKNNKDNESSSNIKKENLSNISTSKIEKEKENEERIQKFITKNDSLYLSASKIAGCCGLNPWCNIPKITIDLIYQGRTGRELLLNDANTIGLELQTDEEILSSFASKAGDDTINAFKHALKVKPKTIQEVEEIQKKVVECANKSNKLKEFEMKALEDGVRHIVSTIQFNIMRF